MMTKKKISIIILLNLVFFLLKSQSFSFESKITGEKNFFHEYNAFNNDGTINVIVEIPAGDNDKWELWKKDGSIRWEFQNNSFRKIKYLPYISNYGFIPQTLFSEEIGGDGDPIDVVLLGERLKRGSVVKSKILGLINMKDEGKLDNKIVAVNHNSFVFNSSILNNFDDLDVNYPGALEIIEIWFKNYKLNNNILIVSYGSVDDAKNLINMSVEPYKLIKGFWENNKE